MIPITRKELYLNKIVGNNDYETPEKPITTEEFFFAEILGEAVQAPEPLTRYQMYLAKIAGKNIEIPYPETRLEYFLARAAGMNVETPTPITREEIYWSNYTAIVEFELDGVPPLTYKAIEGTLKNYRIYGNTVDGESVGDKTGNLFDGTFIHRSVIGAEVCADDPNRRSIVVDISNFNNGDKITFSRETGAGNMFQMYQVSSTLEGGSFLNGNVISGNSETLLAKITLDDISNYHYLMIFLNGALNPITDEELLASKIMVNVGNTPLPYEPYGYKVPVTISNGTDMQTIPIYLPEQIKKVGDEAEYIDYGEQKQHRVRKNLLQNTATSRTVNGVTFTVNDDGSVTCNGTANKNVAYNIKKINLYEANYILTGCPEGGAKNIYSLQYTNNINAAKVDYGEGVFFTPYNSEQYPNISVIISIASGYTCNNLTFYPMIRLATIDDDTYESYIENTDLDVTLPALPTIAETNVLTVGTAVQPSKVYIKGEKEREYS